MAHLTPILLKATLAWPVNPNNKVIANKSLGYSRKCSLTSARLSPFELDFFRGNLAQGGTQLFQVRCHQLRQNYY